MSCTDEQFPLQARGSLFTEFCFARNSVNIRGENFDFSSINVYKLCSQTPGPSLQRPEAGHPETWKVTWPSLASCRAIGAVVEGFEQIRVIYNWEISLGEPSRAMKEFIILHPTCSASPSASHPASLTAGSLASAGLRAPWAGRAAAFPGVGNRRLHPAHPHVPLLTGTEHQGWEWPAGGKLHQTDILRLISAGPYRGWQKRRPREGRPRMGLRPVFHPGDHLPRPAPWAARPMNTAVFRCSDHAQARWLRKP